ncbi:MAG: acyl-CoA dehydrogenase family protein [Chloroflexota bacterium]|nr:acyl-CoA dehydrogenase family protein [Chloroflexota bacterium]
MDFSFSVEEEAFQREVKEFTRRELTEEVIQESVIGAAEGPAALAFRRKVGTKGWVCPAWPRDYGGIGGSNMQKFIIREEIGYHGGPYMGIASDMVGPAVLIYGSEELKMEYLAPIARGEIEVALGYTEPEAGSDLAAIQTSAIEKDDHYFINGGKIFSSGAHLADYHWLLARTDPSLAGHRGLSNFIVDLKSPGITITPMWCMTGRRVNQIFYDNVKVPKKNLVGEKNRGFYQTATALAFERTWVTGDMRRALEMLIEFCRKTERYGKPLVVDSVIQQKLAELAIEVEVTYLLAAKIAWMLDRGTVPEYETSMIKVFGSETASRLAYAGTEILGLYGQLAEGAKWSQLAGRFTFAFLDSSRLTITRGTSEVQRNIIATRGLGLPR